MSLLSASLAFDHHQEVEIFGEFSSAIFAFGLKLPTNSSHTYGILDRSNQFLTFEPMGISPRLNYFPGNHGNWNFAGILELLHGFGILPGILQEYLKFMNAISTNQMAGFLK